MKTIAMFLGAALLAGCGGAPAPLRRDALEGRDERFFPSSPPAPRDLLAREELTLENALALTDALNPLLASERKNVDLAAVALWEARLYPNPEIRLGIEEYRTRDGSTIGKTERTAGVEIPLVLSGRIGRAASLAEAERETAALEFLWRRRQILNGTRRAFISLLSARREAELARESLDLARSVRDASEERFRAQTVPEMEVLKASVALARAEIDLRNARDREAAALQALHAAMGDVDFPGKRISGELAARFPVPHLEALRGHVLALHPLLEAATRAKEAAGLDLSLARAERIPEPRFEVAAGRDPEDATIVEAGLSIPLPLFNRGQARIAGANLRIRQAELRFQAVRNDLLLRLAEDYRAFAAAQDRVHVYRREILPKAEKALDQTAEGYRLGRYALLDLLDAQRTLAESKIAFAAALADLNLAAADLETLAGTRLDPAPKEDP